LENFVKAWFAQPLVMTRLMTAQVAMAANPIAIPPAVMPTEFM
jgi:hypothetical protein